MKKFNKIVAKPFTKKKKLNKEEKAKRKQEMQKGKGFTYKKLEDDYYMQYRGEVGEVKETETPLGSMIVNICLNLPHQVEKPEVHAMYVVPGVDARNVHQVLGVFRKYERKLVDNVILEYWSEYRAVRFIEDDESILKLRHHHVTSGNHFYFVIQVDLDRFDALKNKERYFIHPYTARRRFKKFNMIKDPEKIQITDPFFCEPIFALPDAEVYGESEQPKTSDEDNSKETAIQKMKSWFVATEIPATLDDLLTPTKDELSSCTPPLLPSPAAEFSSSSFFSDGSPSSPISPTDFPVAGPSGLNNPATPTSSRLTPEHMDSRLDPADEESIYVNLRPPELKTDDESDSETKKSSKIYYCQEQPKVAGGQMMQPTYCSTVFVRREKKSGKQWTVDELARLPGDRKNQIRPHNWEKKYLLLRERTLYFVTNHELLLKYYHMEDVEFLGLLHVNYGKTSKEKTIKKIGEAFKLEFYHCPSARAHYTAPFGSVIIVRNLDPNLNPVKMMFCPVPNKESTKAFSHLSDDGPDIDKTSRLKNLWMTAFRLAKVGANHKASYMHYVFEYQKYSREKYLQRPHEQRMQNYKVYWQRLAEEEYLKWRETKPTEEESKASKSTIKDLISFIS